MQEANPLLSKGNFKATENVTQSSPPRCRWPLYLRSALTIVLNVYTCYEASKCPWAPYKALLVHKLGRRKLRDCLCSQLIRALLHFLPWHFVYFKGKDVRVTLQFLATNEDVTSDTHACDWHLNADTICQALRVHSVFCTPADEVNLGNILPCWPFCMLDTALWLQRSSYRNIYVVVSAFTKMPVICCKFWSEGKALTNLSFIKIISFYMR